MVVVRYVAREMWGIGVGWLDDDDLWEVGHPLVCHIGGEAVNRAEARAEDLQAAEEREKGDARVVYPPAYVSGAQPLQEDGIGGREDPLGLVSAGGSAESHDAVGLRAGR